MIHSAIKITKTFNSRLTNAQRHSACKDICDDDLSQVCPASLQRQTSMTEMERWLTGWMDGCTVESKLATLNDV